MGGDLEKVVEPAKSKSDGKEVLIGTKLRLHENKAEGKVHFHDDASSLKVGIPTPEFYVQWRNWKSAPVNPLIFIDPEKETKLTLEAITTDNVVDIAGTITAIKIGDTYKKIDAFAKGR